ncbi:Uncharacterized membrane protein [Pseudomonas pohangensis]|uniref:Uncharacterized membrane protein n=1 Tax=Pseudomonas pohangensis TaxID=364197 RepID=A0A1H2G167_9PSED|nr:PACE efflux transporter [Pseudomonas pohangensis]SDU13305.1 Uncharacterized membrane protein [Pseudomonas pohangensis]
MIRSFRERLLQCLCYEAIGVCAFMPLVSLLLDKQAGAALLLLLPLSLAAVSTTVLFNSLFDHLEYKHCGRLASNRPHRVRLFHALLLEVCVALATVPLIKYQLHLSWLQALAADAVLMVLYALYGYLFFWAYDRLRPASGA